MTITDQTNTAWPPITATLSADGTAEVVVAGAKQPTIPATNLAEAREAVKTTCARTAAGLGRPVTVTVTEPDGVAVLEIDPDGSARQVAAPPAPRRRIGKSAPVTASTPVVRQEPTPLPQAPELRDFRATRPPSRGGHAERGWQGQVHRMTGGRISPAPGEEELARRKRVRSVRRQLAGPRTIVIANPKGGAPKTTCALALAATFGRERGGWVVAADLNENRGTLGLRALADAHQTNTVIDLLRDRSRFLGDDSKAGDLDNYVRAQGEAHFDVLASSENPFNRDAVGKDEVNVLRTILAKFYRVTIFDTGNSSAAPNWRAAIESADALVVPISLDETSADHAAAMLDDLRDDGHEDLVRNAVTVLVHINGPESQAARIRQHFGPPLTRVVLDVPSDPALSGGKRVIYDALSKASQEAWLSVAAAVAEGL